MKIKPAVKPIRAFAVFVSAILLVRAVEAFTAFPDLVFPHIQVFFSKLLISFSSLFPFSAGDIFYTLLAVFSLVFIVRFAKAIIQKDRAGISDKISGFFYFFTILYLVFHLLWGFNYYKTPLKYHYDTENIELDELKQLAEFYLQQSIKDRYEVNEDEEGVFEFRLNRHQIDSLIVRSSEKLKKNYPELGLNAQPRPNIKKSLYSTLFSYLGVLGYYNPFTGEAQYNSNVPPTKMLFTQMHETAHQWGFAPENEANFIGFLIGTHSDCIDFRYAGHYMALRQILNRIVWEDPAFVEKLLEKYSPQMKRDRAYEIEIQLKYNHSADDAFSMLNEAYLRLNNQEGLESYGKFVELLTGHNRKYNHSKK